MRLSFVLSAAILALSPSVVTAQAAVAPSAGKLLVTSDGKRVGPIDRIVRDAGGAPRSVAVIYDSHFVYVPYETLTVGEKGRVTTSLSQKDVRALH